MDEQPDRKERAILVAVTAVLAAIVATVYGMLIGRWRKKLAEPPLPPPPLLPQSVLDLEGLTEEEAIARRQEGQDNALIFNPPRTQREIWRSNIYTIFNLSLLGLVGVQLLIGKFLDALITLGVMFLNVGLNVGQEMFARRRIQDVEKAARPQATVIRESQARSIDPSEIVQGDILVAGAGDQILVDGLVVGEGHITIDESMLTGKSERQTKTADDAVYAGSVCVAGRAAYQAYKVGDERLIVALTDKTEPAKEELTTLEKIIDRVLRFLLVFVALYTILLIIRWFQLDRLIPVDVVNNAASVIFNIAPASLFFMIILTYASGIADLAKLGALVHRPRSVESLAQTNSVCFAKAGILTGTHVSVEALEPPAGQSVPSESRLRQILGDYARSSSVDNLVMRGLKSTFPGDRREVVEEMSFIALHGWTALTFDDDDLRGVFVLGNPQILEPYLLVVEEEIEEPVAEEETEAPVWRRAVSPLGRLFRRSEPKDGEAEEEQTTDDPNSELEPSPDKENGDPPFVEEEAKRPNLFARFGKRVRGITQRDEGEPQTEGEPVEEMEDDATALLFAFVPEIVPLYDADGAPSLPQDLMRLCTLRYSEEVRPEAIETILALAEMGIEIKIFAPGSPETSVAAFQQAGFSEGGSVEANSGYRILSAQDLADLGPDELAEATRGHILLGNTSPEQAGYIVKALRQQGQAVTVVGDGVSNLPALQQANLAISSHSGSQAVLSVADIVVLEESPAAILRVVDKGQRIVNGLLDVLKLYLVQVAYLLVLVGAIALLTKGFPYKSGQGTVIALATAQLPALALTLWASSGVLPSHRLGWLLGRFVIPAAITMSIAALAVYVYFYTFSGKHEYAQIALMHILVFMGLGLVVFVKPPGRARISGGAGEGDVRPLIMCLVLLVVFIVVTYVPLAQELLYVAPLGSLDQYGIVAGVAVVWAVVVHIVWRLIPVQRRA